MDDSGARGFEDGRHTDESDSAVSLQMSRGQSEGRPSGDRDGELFEVFGLLKNYFDTQLSSLRKEICQQKPVMKLDIPIFNSASCKAQFRFNTELCTLLYSVVNCDSLRLAKEKCK